MYKVDGFPDSLSWHGVEAFERNVRYTGAFTIPPASHQVTVEVGNIFCRTRSSTITLDVKKYVKIAQARKNQKLIPMQQSKS